MKKALCFFSLIFLYQIVYSQAPVIEWQNTIGGSAWDILSTMSKTFDGGSICGGSSQSGISADKTEICLGGKDYWVVKLDGYGNIQWQNTIGGGGNDELLSIKQTSDAGYICGGKSESGITGDKTENTNGLFDFWVVKLGPTGNVQWDNTIGGSNNDILYSISQTIDGGYICGGESSSDANGDKTQASYGYSDCWVIKLDQSGIIQWQKTIGGSDNEYFHSISQTPDGGYICGGSSNSGYSGIKLENSNGSYDYWVVKLDSLGNIQWQNTIGGNNIDVLNSISITVDGGYICGGYSSSNLSGDKTEPFIGSTDYWVVKLDTSGNVLWDNTIGGLGDDLLYYTSQTQDGGYICSGASNSGLSGDKSEDTIGDYDCWFVKLDANGSIQWQNTIGGTYSDEAHFIEQTEHGDFICGVESLSDISGDKTENSNGPDYWLFKLTDRYNSICGKLFIDFNSNTLKDTAEPIIKNKLLFELNTKRFCFSDIHGAYSQDVLDSGNYSVTPNPINYYNAVPVIQTAYFSGLQQTDSLNDFAFQPTGVFNDLKIKLTPLGSFRTGRNAFYRLDYQNLGTTNLTGDVVFYIDSTLNYIGSTTTPTSTSSDSIVWNTGILSPFQSGSLTVTMQVNQNVPVGTLIYSIGRIFPIAGDVVPQDNISSWEVFVTASHDPNDILVNRSEILTTELPNPPWLEYIIHFQNTGTDTAFVVKVFNAIDTNRLDLNSFEFEATSHPVNINYNYFARRFEFSFPNILLPDSNVNELASHGFIRYRIKPLTTLAANDSIKNNALIFFDFNAAVETNTAITTIVLPAGISSSSLSNATGIKLFPNPASETITIQLTNPNEIIREIKIHDLLGRTIFENQPETKNFKLQTDIGIFGFPKGIYIIEVLTGKNTYRGRVIKQ